MKMGVMYWIISLGNRIIHLDDRIIRMDDRIIRMDDRYLEKNLYLCTCFQKQRIKIRNNMFL